MSLSPGPWLETYTGRRFYFLTPTPDMVVPEDVAHALSLRCRYGGHCKHFYSVAEHSVHVSDYVFRQTADVELTLLALLHDAAEAYLPDVVSPMKPLLQGFKEIEERVERAIWARFGAKPARLDFVRVKEVDTRILVDERRALMTDSGHGWTVDGLEPLGAQIGGWQPEVAERIFLERLSGLLLLR